MSDLISKQAAISAICNACGKIDCDKMDKCEKLQLPPANCSEFPNNSDAISRQAALDAIMGQPPEPHYPSWYAAQIEKLPAVQPEQRWIPIKNRLPAVRCCRCLITRDDGRGRATVEEALFSFGRWYSNEWLEDGRNRKFDISASVIAWAPFPAPYRGGEK